MLSDHNFLTEVDGLNAVHGAAGKFILIPGVEVTDRFGEKPIHVNGLNLERLVQPQGGTSVADTVSLEQPIGEDGAQLGDFIEDEEAVDPVRVTEEMDIANSLRRSIERLPDREGRILALRYGFYDGVPRTLEEIGDEFNLTRERIRQLEKLALCRLRHPSFGIREQDLV